MAVKSKVKAMLISSVINGQWVCVNPFNYLTYFGLGSLGQEFQDQSEHSLIFVYDFFFSQKKQHVVVVMIWRRVD